MVFHFKALNVKVVAHSTRQMTHSTLKGGDKDGNGSRRYRWYGY